MHDMPLSVAFLGPAGTFTEAALRQYAAQAGWGEIEALPVDSPGEALDAVRAGRAQRAVVAIENSVDGAVTATFDALGAGGEDGRVQVYGEVDLEIAFALMGADAGASAPGERMTIDRKSVV